ncbi:MAG TPA: hypothetical protein VGM10_29100 [Actinocrinis sp.]
MKALVRISAMAAGAALALVAALPAQADSSSASPSPSAASGKGAAKDSLSAAQALVTSRIDGRLSTLQALTTSINSSKYLASADKTTLANQIGSDTSGLTALKSKVASETTVAAVRTDAVAMVDDYRVYLLMAPQVRLSDALDAEAAAATTLQNAYTKLSTLLSQNGGITSAEQSELSDMQAQINAAKSADNGQIATLLGLKPGPDASSLTGSVKAVSAAAKSARGDLVKARADAKQLRSAVKSAKPSSPAASASASSSAS